MREILFRGFTPDKNGRGKVYINGEWIKGQWVKGSYMSIDKTTYCFKEDYDKHPDNTEHYIIFDQMTDWGLPNRHLQADVLPETVGQYTGLKDCNGKEIYEGDIVRAEHNITKTWGEGSVEDGTLVVREEIVDSFSVEGDVCFEDGSFMVEGYYTGIFMPLEIEIIGNIHDNPELLKGAR